MKKIKEKEVLITSSSFGEEFTTIIKLPAFCEEEKIKDYFEHFLPRYVYEHAKGIVNKLIGAGIEAIKKKNK